MKKYNYLTFLLILLLIFNTATITTANSKTINLIKFFDLGTDYLINYKIGTMSLEQKVGQLFQVGFHSQTVDPEIQDLIENYHIGGVIYFTRNIANLEQTKKLSETLQNLALENGAAIPLFIAVDQEGGKVRRIKDLSYFPANRVLGDAANKARTRKTAEITAKELKELGINVNLAPVLDVNNNPDNPVIGERSYGSDPELVAEMGVAYIKGLHSEQVIATAKHFPGHGDTKTDSHINLPVIYHSRERLEKIELYPFKKAIEAGVEIIMTAHIYFPAIEAEYGVPATLSKSVLQILLREELEFQGLIITDDMEMGAVSKNFGTAEGAVKSIKAGTDLVLIAHSYEKQKSAIKMVIEAVKKGEITEKRIEKSLQRIIKLKVKRLNTFK